MAMDLRAYLAFRCNQMLRMERDIQQMNTQMANEVQEPRLKEAFQRHSQPTAQQVSNLEQVVSRLGSKQQQGQREGLMERAQEMVGMGGAEGNHPVTQSMMREHKQFMDMHPPQNLIDINNALEGDKVKHMEMASYNGLIAVAQQLSETEVVSMLQQNLQGEQQMCTALEGSLPSLLSQSGGAGRMAA